LETVKELDSTDKSLSDLYSLIHSQNEQLRHLQAQVDTLLLTREMSSSAATPVCASIQSLKKHISVVDESTQTVITNIHHDAAVNTDPSPVVSVGIMTTFTDAADSQQLQDMKRTAQRNRKPRSGNR
jgi:alpha-galactosidase/6-phospho-beta-glucosidase family protein